MLITNLIFPCMARRWTVLRFVRYFFRSSLWRYGLALNKYSDPRTFGNGFIFYHIIIIVVVVVEFLTSRLWLGNTHLSWHAAINRIRLGGLICSLKSFLQLNMCQELQIFAAVYMYWGAS